MSQSVVLVHGLRTSATMWRRQVALLEGLGHEAIAVDLPGHGARMDERFTLDGAVQTVADAVERATHPVFVCGFSLGGYVAIRWLGGGEVSTSSTRKGGSTSKDKVVGLLAASCGTRPYRAVLEAWRAAARVIHAFPDRGLGLNNWAVRMAVRDPELADDVIRGGVALEVMDDALRELRGLDPVASLRRIRQPVWLANGTLDHFRIEERRYAAAAPDARLIHIPGATHMVSLTKPAEFDRVLVSALDSNAPKW